MDDSLLQAEDAEIKAALSSSTPGLLALKNPSASSNDPVKCTRPVELTSEMVESLKTKFNIPTRATSAKAICGDRPENANGCLWDVNEFLGQLYDMGVGK